MKMALCARVSSEKQDVDLSISAQLKALRNYAAQHGHEVVSEFVDEAESGRTAHRPVFQEMISLCRQKPAPFQGVLVWKLSRFARNRGTPSSASPYFGNKASGSSPSTSQLRTVQPGACWRG